MNSSPSFIETQFPVSKLSKESYKERKANHGQTLTGLGKWWGRKPLILVRAAILGLLLPVTEDPKKDRDIFLRLLTMDEDGLWHRKFKNLTAASAYELLTPSERAEWFAPSPSGKIAFRRGLTAEDKEHIQKRAFLRLNYDTKLSYCLRPEEVGGPSAESWDVINEHLGTTAASINELVDQLGHQRFGHTPRVGDAFCGGGSIPFEAARIGCEAYGSDLSPVAALLTWAALNIVGGEEDVANEVRQALAAVYHTVKQQIDTWGIERNAVGWVADAYLYCHEVQSQGWLVPLAPSWIIGERTRTIAQLVPDVKSRRFHIEIHQGVSDEAMEEARREGTWDNGVKCPVDAEGNPVPHNRRIAASADTLRGSGGLRLWEKDDIVPRSTDIYQERLYCIRWRLPQLDVLLWEEQRVRFKSVPSDECRQLSEIKKEIHALEVYLTEAGIHKLNSLRERDWQAEDATLTMKVAEYERLKVSSPKKVDKQEVATARQEWQVAQQQIEEREATIKELAECIPKTLYSAVNEEDEEREQLVLKLIRERFVDWQNKGYIPSAKIEPGSKTEEPIRTRGFSHWSHLFNPRQLLTIGIFSKISEEMHFSAAGGVACALSTGRLADWNSRLARWDSSAGSEKSANTFSNQALNTLLNYSCRPLPALYRSWFFEVESGGTFVRGSAKVLDARGEVEDADFWITDPAYADAVNYEELGEFFLAWYQKRIPRLFPEWYTDSKRALAVRGSDEAFRLAMVECYSNFARHMPDEGLQIVMFTHTDSEVWADLALILWASGLRVTAAWTIATETEASGLRQGNYVQGTVLLVLRKQMGNEWGDLTDIFPRVQREVEQQMASMLALEDMDDPNFSDADYQLAAYAAALRVLTHYKEIEEIDVQREIRRVRGRDDRSPLSDVIKKAVQIASDYLVPRGIDRSTWRSLSPEERLYVKGIEVESHGDYRSGVYMEFARGYGVRDYQVMLGSTTANLTRLKTPSEFRSSSLSGEGFANSLLRQVLFAIYKTADTNDPGAGREWLRREVSNYWDRRATILSLLQYFITVPTSTMTHWKSDKAAAELLVGLISNDTI